jgi:hypothetical protein
LGGAELEIPFSSLDDLGSQLKVLDLNELSRLLVDTVGHVVTGEQRAPRPDLEGICTTGPMGLPRFSKIPSSKGAYVALALYAVEPRRLSANEIETVTGIDRVSSHYLSAPKLKKHFQKDAESRFGLTTEGKRWVTEEILLGLR